MCGNANDLFVAILLPFSSFAPSSPAIVVSVPLTVGDAIGSGWAYANGGFVDGDRPIIDSDANPPIVGGGGVLAPTAWAARAPLTLTNMLVDVGTSYTTHLGWGWSDALNYTMRFVLANDTTFVNGSATLALAPSIAVGALHIVDPVDGVTKRICYPVGSATPAGCVAVASVCGGCIASISGPAPCLQSNCTGGFGAGVVGGALTCVFNNVSASVSLIVTGVPLGFKTDDTPVDDPFSPLNVPEPSSLTVSGVVVYANANASLSVVRAADVTRVQITLGKSRALSGGAQAFLPGAVVQYTLTVNVAPSHVYSAVSIVDRLDDGLEWNAAQAPLLRVDGRVLPIGADSVAVDLAAVGNDGVATDGTDGTTRLAFDVSALLAALAQVPTVAQTVQVVYFATIRAAYTDRSRAGFERSLFAGDCLLNSAALTATLVSPLDGVAALGVLTRGASASVSVPTGTFTAALYAVNGALCASAANTALCTQVDYEPLTAMTFEVTYAMASDSFDALSISEALPVPIFDVASLSWPRIAAGGVVDVDDASNTCAGSAVPALNRMCFSPRHQYARRSPVFDVHAPSMTWSLDYGTSAYSKAGSAISVLVTANLTGQPWIDGFDIVALTRKTENAASRCADQPLRPLFFRLSTPKLCMTQAVVLSRAFVGGAVTAHDARFTAFSTTGTPFAGTITQANTSASFGVASLAGVQAGDALRVVVLVTGQGRGSAYDIRLDLPLAAESAFAFSDPTNVRAFYGNGTAAALSYDAATGVATVPQLTGASTRAGLDTTGRNMLVLVYDVTLLPAFPIAQPAGPLVALRAALLEYAARPSTDNYVTTLHARGQYAAACLSSTIALSAAQPTLAAELTSDDACTLDSLRDVAPGEQFRVRTTVTLPYGTLANAAVGVRMSTTGRVASLLSMTLLANPATSSTGVAVGAALAAAPLTGAPPAAASLALGGLTLATTAASRALVVESVWRTDNGTSIVDALALTFEQSFGFEALALPVSLVSALPAVTVRRQTVTLVGGTNSSAARPFDEGDVIRYCFNVTRALATACAYNTVVSVAVPSVLSVLSAPVVLQLPGATALAGATVTGGAGSQTLSASIPTIDKAQGAVAVCFDALFAQSFAGTLVRTTATACTSTTPLASTAARTCVTANADVTPTATAALSSSTSDACTNNAQRIAHVGELITANVTTTIPAGATNPLLVDLSWTTASKLLVVSSRVVSYGSCITTPTLALGTAATLTTNRLRWSFGNMQRTTQEIAGCDQVVLEAVLQVAAVTINSHLSTFTLTASATGGGLAQTPAATQGYTVLLPTLTMATTLTPAAGDAGDTARFCFTLTNGETNTLRATCAYNVTVATPLPAGYASEPNPLTASFASISPGATTAATCYNLTLSSTVQTSVCSNFAATATYESDPVVSTRRTVTSTRAYCTASPTVTARIAATSDPCTVAGKADAGVTGVHHGEVITYEIVVRVPEGVAATLTPTVQLSTLTAYVAGSATIVRFGASLAPQAPTPVVAGGGGTVSWPFVQLANAPSGAANADDEIVLQLQAVVSSAATWQARFAPVVTVAHAGATLTVGNATLLAEVVEAVLVRTSAVTPTDGGAYGDATVFSATIAHGPLSSGCASNVEVCEAVPVDMDFAGLGSVVIAGVSPAPAAVARATGFCVTLPTLAAAAQLTVQYRAVFRDLPAGVNRCASGTAAATAALVPRVASSSVCAPQQVLEALGDFVWTDSNGNGRQDAGEPAIAGAAVRLRLASTSAVIATVASSATGFYRFDRFAHGMQANTAYDVELDARAGVHATLLNRDADTGDSDGTESGGVVAVRGVRVATRTQNLTVDFGFAAPIVLGDFVWRDANGDGVQNDAGAGVAGLLVQLRLSNGTVIGTTATSAAGLYSFSSLDVPLLRPGATYVIAIPLDSQPQLAVRVGGRDTHLVPTRRSASTTTSALDSNAVLDAQLSTALVSVTVADRWNQVDASLDVGLVVPPPIGVRIGDRVFYDINSNGVQDGEDLSISGLALQLLDSFGAVVATTATNATGHYFFTRSFAGEPPVFVVVVPLGQAQLIGRAPTLRDFGGSDALDSDATVDPETGSIFVTLVAPIDGSNDLTIDIGVRDPAPLINSTIVDSSLPMCLATQRPCQSATMFDGRTCAFNDVCAAQYQLTSIDLLKTEAPISLEPGRVVGTNALELVVQHPAVADRVVESIVLLDANPACNYPGPNWCKGLQTSWATLPSGARVCRDIYVSNIPWSVDCGLKREENATHVCFGGAGLVNYNDSLGALDSIELGARKVSSVIRFALCQPKVISDISTVVRILDEPRLLGALTRQRFDFVTGNATLAVILSMAAPLRTTAVVSMRAPSGAVMSQIGVVDNARCGDHKDALCQQTYTFAVDPQARCDLDGDFQITYSVACHPSVANTPDCPVQATIAPMQFNVTLDTEDFCAVVRGLLQVSGSMTSHGDFAAAPFAFGPQKTAFFQNQPMHFQVLANSLNGFPLADSKISTVELRDKQGVRRTAFNLTAGGATPGWTFATTPDPANAQLATSLTHRLQFSLIAAPTVFGDVERNVPINSTVVVSVEVAFRNPIGVTRKRLVLEAQQVPSPADNRRLADAVAIVRVEAPPPPAAETTAPTASATESRTTATVRSSSAAQAMLATTALVVVVLTALLL